MEERKIFVLGDSISIHYGPFLKAILPDGFSYDRKRGLHHALEDLDNPVGANGGDSRQVLEYLEEEYRMGTKYDVLLVNCGLHDIRRRIDDGVIQVSLPEYISNVAEIVKIGHEMSKELVWVETTPVIDEIHNSLSDKMHRYSSDLNAYRNAADWVLNEYDVPVIRLHDFTETFGAEAFIDHVHFIEPVREKQAVFIKEKLFELIGK